ncbi:MAG TPA: diadenylate cyclase [Polyangia bacterium]|nr:diadenylate cyclase [Polyangia bacterium]
MSHLLSPALIHSLRWQDAVDIALITLLFSSAYGWLKRTRAVQVTLGLLTLLAASWVANRIGLILTSYLLSAGGAVATLVVVVAFQHEIRRALSGVSPFNWLWRRRNEDLAGGTFAAVAEAAFAIAGRGKGALIVLPRRDPLGDLVTAGTEVDGRLSAPLVEAIFTSAAPLHDGAVVVREDRLSRAGVVLPLATGNVPAAHGTRHRAALGLAQASDALVICVSEETGAVYLGHDDALERMPDPVKLREKLRQLGSPGSGGGRVRRVKLRRRLLGAVPYAAIFVAVLLAWGVLALDRTQVIARAVPLEIRGIRAGLAMDAPRTTSVVVELQSSREELELLPPGAVEAYVDVSGSTAGTRSYRVLTRVPAGIEIASISPSSVSIPLHPRETGRPPEAPGGVAVAAGKSR